MSKEQLSTSGKEIPKHKNALEEKYQSKESHVKRLDQDNIQSMLDQLPESIWL
jgi:adenylylsulfate kinase-like enzyme